MVQCYYRGPSNKRVEFKFMKEIKPGHYLSMPEMIVELNAKVLAEPNYINLHLDGFDVCFDYDYFSNKPVVTMSHGVSIKEERSDLALRLGFKENEILRGPTPIVSPFMTNMERYTEYICLHRYHSESVGYVRAHLLRVVPVKSR